MIRKRITPSPELAKLVECYWIIEFNEPPHVQKIIPDGFPELIFHYKDKYRINLDGNWVTQSRSLMAGQIRKFFFLENTGEAGMFGIKLKPTAITHLFGLSMRNHTDRVVGFASLQLKKLNDLEKVIRQSFDHRKMVESAEQYLKSIIPFGINENKADKAIELILKSKGIIGIQEICNTQNISARHLERLFTKFVGLSPKFYSRIIRFSNIFQLTQMDDTSWSNLSYHSGFYDQSHFIRNFKAFTGEDPSVYFFEEPTMANFFLKKS